MVTRDPQTEIKMLKEANVRIEARLTVLEKAVSEGVSLGLATDLKATQACSDATDRDSRLNALEKHNTDSKSESRLDVLEHRADEPEWVPVGTPLVIPPGEPRKI